MTDEAITELAREILDYRNSTPGWTFESLATALHAAGYSRAPVSVEVADALEELAQITEHRRGCDYYHQKGNGGNRDCDCGLDHALQVLRALATTPARDDVERKNALLKEALFETATGPDDMPVSVLSYDLMKRIGIEIGIEL